MPWVTDSGCMFNRERVCNLPKMVSFRLPTLSVFYCGWIEFTQGGTLGLKLANTFGVISI
jgi:hypothetical protein